MKKSFLYLSSICMLLWSGASFTACDDFFQPETDDALKGDDYMSSITEMATGYLGILTKMQEIGDKEIYLTDTRGELLEPTEQSIAPLIALYNYEEDLTGNAYADPAGYYDVVIACNDYISKMTAFHRDHPELVAETDYFEGLLASAIRVKAWTYMTLAEIYGQALWFDDPITSIKDVNDASIFSLLNTAQIVSRCVDLLEKPFQCNNLAINPATDFSWIAWVDPEHAQSISESNYRFWDQMTPPYKAMLSRLKLWDAAFQDAVGNQAAAQADYEMVADTILNMLHTTFVGNVTYWKRGARVLSNYDKIWNYPTPNQEESVSAIIYDYTKNQTNQLLYHFSHEYPNKYLLSPSEVGRARFTENLGAASEDKRANCLLKLYDGRWCIGKFRPMYSSVRSNAYQDDVHIYTFRSAELYLWLAEALNHLGRFEALSHIMNDGFNSTYSALFTNIETEKIDSISAKDYFQYKGFSSYWVSSKTGATFQGFRGCLGIGQLDIWNTVNHTKEEAIQHNDSLIANEWMLECACEGKVYPNLIRMAERYQDDDIVASRVTPKYGAKAAEIEGKIKAINPNSNVKGYYVPWKLR